jgi:hypothetical protein
MSCRPGARCDIITLEATAIARFRQSSAAKTTIRNKDWDCRMRGGIHWLNGHGFKVNYMEVNAHMVPLVLPAVSGFFDCHQGANPK